LRFCQPMPELLGQRAVDETDESLAEKVEAGGIMQLRNYLTNIRIVV